MQHHHPLGQAGHRPHDVLDHRHDGDLFGLPYLFDELDHVDCTRKTVVFSQTTMDKEGFYKIADVLRKKVAEFVVGTFEESAIDFHAKDTICGQVSGRDKKLREFAAANDVMVFVAGKNSSNGKVLFDICRDANPRTIFIEKENEMQSEWFENAESVGVSGATSTPQWLMERVKLVIEQMTKEVVV